MTSDFKAIRLLIRLLDAESASIRERVRGELRAQGAKLKGYLSLHGSDHDPAVLYTLHELAHSAESDAMLGAWLGWISVHGEYRKLERALSFLADFQAGAPVAPSVGERLDALAQRFIASRASVDALSLSRFLFGENRFVGAVRDFFHPRNSSLDYALTHGRGLPITLTCLFMLCGHRLGLRIHGCNLPGHFLAQARVGGRPVLIDCFHGGKALDAATMNALPLSPQQNINHYLKNPPTAIDIIARVLANLTNAYAREGRVSAYRHCQFLARELRGARAAGLTRLLIGPSRTAVAFEPGCLVRHRLYGYRAVVVEREAHPPVRSPDEGCNEPWYRLLVAESALTAHARHGHLEVDQSGEEIQHPLIDTYFKRFHAGRYLRNDRPWIESG